VEIPADVLERIAATVREVIETPELARFGIGRSAQPTQRGHDLGADAVIEIFRTDSPEEAGEVELHLAQRFAREAKWKDLGEPLGGEGTRVYVALWAADDISEP